MDKILFACFHHLELGTANPLAAKFRDGGDLTGLLTLFSNRHPCDSFPGERFHCPRCDVEEGGPTDPYATERLRRVILPLGDDLKTERLVGLLCRHYRETREAFPFHVEKWVPRWRQFVERTLSAFVPDVVVISLGQFETPIVRRICAERGIPCLYALVPFFEFKDVERVPILQEFATVDEFCVAGLAGKRRLQQAGIADAQIVMTGTPLFEPLASTRQASGRSIPRTILYTEQSLLENDRLRVRLFDYVANRDAVRLILRPHPTTTADERQARSREIGARSLEQRVCLSSAGVSLADDLSRASVLVTISSVTMCEAAIVGVPAICWHPTFLPTEIPCLEGSPIKLVGTTAELESALDFSWEADSPARNAAIPEWAGIGNSELATERICRQIRSKIRQR